MESIETLNRRLVDEFGADSDTNQPMFRIVWANDQLEKRLTEYTEKGTALLYPIVMEMKKYPYLKDTYVLEQLVVVPEMNMKELPASKLSYEPIWAYRDGDDNPLPPIWPATKFVIDTLYAAMGKKGLAKYVDSEKNTTPEGRELRISELAQELFGNETETGDAMKYGEAIVVPNSYDNKRKED